MIIYLIYLITIFVPFLYLKFRVLSNEAVSKTFKINAYFISFILLALIIGLRKNNIGTDTNSYVETYLGLQSIDWKTLFLLSKNTSYGFSIYEKLISLIFPRSYTMFLLITGILISAIYTKFIFDNSIDPPISITIGLSLGYIYFFMSGIKQSLAIVILLISFNFIMEKRFIKFLLLVLLASLFHATAIIFIISYPLYWMKIKRISFIVGSLILVLLFFRFGSNIFDFIKYFLGNELYSEYGTEYQSAINLTGFFIQFLCIVFSLVLSWRSKNQKINGLLNISVIGLLFQILTSELAEFFRISMYFSIFNLVLIPLSIGNVKGRKDKSFFKYIVIVVFILYFIFFSGNDKSLVPYSFFWD